MSNNVGRIRMHREGPEFSRIVWGSMRSEEQFSSVDALADHLRFLLDHGITTLDTAAVYGKPEAFTTEAFLGAAVAKVGRDKFEIVSKLGNYRPSVHKKDVRLRYFDSSPQEITSSVDRSLQQLGIDILDVMLVHWPDFLMDADETAGALDAVVAAGKVRYVGVSNFSPSRFTWLQSRLKAPLVTNQVQFNALHLNPIADGTFDLALQLGHMPMIWSPVAGGRLLKGDDAEIVAMRDLLTGMAAKYDLDGPAEAAFAFVSRHPAGRVPIVGTADRRRIEGAIKAIGTEMDRQDWYQVATQYSPRLRL